MAALSPSKVAKLIAAGAEHVKALRFSQAEAVLLQALRMDQRQHGALHLLGVLALRDGRNDLAIERWQRALALAPGTAAYLSNLGEALRRSGNTSAAIEALQQALEFSPDMPEAHHNLGLTYEALGEWPLAAEAFETALALKPTQLESQRRLGGALRRLRRFDQALAHLSSACEREPDHAAAHAELGLVWKELGCVERAVDCLRRAVTLNPSAREVHGNLIYTLAFDPRASPRAILEEARLYEERHAAPNTAPPPVRDTRPERKLRIGYLSPDFCDHVLAHFYLPLFRHRDRNQFELYCYSNVRAPDAVTERVRETADVLRDISNLDDEQALELIRGDEIDILIDLTMHMMENRLPLLARRPAPVTAT